MNETLREILRELYRLSALCEQQAGALREKDAELATLKRPAGNGHQGNGQGTYLNSVPAEAAAAGMGSVERTRE